MAGSEQGAVVFRAPCYRYEVSPGSVLAREWRRRDRGTVCEIEVTRSASEDGLPYICSIREAKEEGSFQLYVHSTLSLSVCVQKDDQCFFFWNSWIGFGREVGEGDCDGRE